VFIDGRKAATLRGPSIADDFRGLVEAYVERRWGSRDRIERTPQPSPLAGEGGARSAPGEGAVAPAAAE
jgi:hypothetical protein